MSAWCTDKYSRLLIASIYWVTVLLDDWFIRWLISNQWVNWPAAVPAHHLIRPTHRRFTNQLQTNKQTDQETKIDIFLYHPKSYFYYLKP
jgi:hypothetical protein